MSNKKSVHNFKRSRRTQKIVETLAEKKNREDNFLNRLDEIAGEILSKRLSGEKITPPTKTEPPDMRGQEPELAETCEILFTVANKVNKL